MVMIIRYGDWTDIDYAVTKTRESYGFNNVVSINIGIIAEILKSPQKSGCFHTGDSPMAP